MLASRCSANEIIHGSQAVELTLGLSEADLANGDDASFAQLGGDSLAAIQFARTIDELCGVPLPVSFVLDHSNSLAAITSKARAAATGSSMLSASSADPVPHRTTISVLDSIVRMLLRFHKGFGHSEVGFVTFMPVLHAPDFTRNPEP